MPEKQRRLIDVRMKDGTIVTVPEGTPKADILRRHRALSVLGPILSFAKNAVDVAGFGFDDELGAVRDAISPIKGQRNVWAGDSFGDAWRANQQRRERGKQAISKANPKSAIAGSIAGALLPALLTGGASAAGGGGAAARGMFGRGARAIAPSVAQGAAYGAGSASGGVKERAKGAATGAAVGLAGDLVGRGLGKVVASVASPFISKATKLTRPERIIARNTDDAARASLEEAKRLGLPFGMADASTQTRGLAGTVTRFSPDARAAADDLFGPRNLDRGQRAITAINNFMSPPVDMRAVSEGIKTAGRRKAKPLYDAVIEAADRGGSTWSPRLQQFLDDPITGPALKRGAELQRLESLAAGKPFDPTRLSVTGFNEAGEPILSKTPNMLTLDAIKKGFDDIVGDGTDKVTGEMSASARAVNQLRKAFVAELDDINPAYKQARAAAQDYLRSDKALTKGYKAVAQNVRPEDVARNVQSMGTKELAQYRSGYASRLRDMVNDASDSTNPYRKIYGSASSREKIGTVFPGSADDMAATYRLEGEMARTANEVLGGSQTQPRAVLDKQFAGEDAIDAVNALTMLSRGNLDPFLVIKAATGGIKALNQRNKLGMFGTKAKADELAPYLINSSPDDALRILEEIARKQREREMSLATVNQIPHYLGRAGTGGALGLYGLSP